MKVKIKDACQNMREIEKENKVRKEQWQIVIKVITEVDKTTK